MPNKINEVYSNHNPVGTERYIETKADEANSDYKLDKRNKTHRHTAIISQTKETKHISTLQP